MSSLSEEGVGYLIRHWSSFQLIREAECCRCRLVEEGIKKKSMSRSLKSREKVATHVIARSAPALGLRRGLPSSVSSKKQQKKYKLEEI